jgi:hypothetical protein
MQVWYFCFTLLDVCWSLKMYCCIKSHTQILVWTLLYCIYVNASISPQWSCRACWTTTWGHVSLPKYIWYVWENGQAWYGHDLLEQEQLLVMCLSFWMHTVKWCRPGKQPFDWDWFCYVNVLSHHMSYLGWTWTRSFRHSHVCVLNNFLNLFLSIIVISNFTSSS